MQYHKELQRICAAHGAACLLEEPMSLHTSFKIGGPAELFVKPRDTDCIAALSRYCKEHGLPMTIIGKGSNLLVADTGLRGVVVRLGTGFGGISLADETTIRCSAGLPLAQVCYFAYRHGLTGLEFAWGIPGSAGGAAYMNAGAYGGEMKDVLAACSHLSADGTPGEFAGDALDLSYRHSAYTDSDKCITGLTLRLQKGNPADIRARMDDLMNRRRTKQPLEFPSAGSTFKRPAGNYASALIEQCGLKGARVGGAMVSPKHSGFVINAGNATCEDVRGLIRHVQQEVYKQTGYTLDCEVKLLGF